LPGKVPEHVVRQVASSCDIVRLIGRYCKLRQRGKKFWALCPFHQEKTPSFSVDPEQGLYYCFGCGEGGNIFTFLNKAEGLQFYDALQMLAREAGIDLARYEAQAGPSREQLELLRRANELAATFYAKCLEKAKGSDRARSYLKQRRISEESVARWRIGYAPPGWENLLDCARRHGIEPGTLEAAGLAVRRSEAEGHYDRFRDRLMFPVCDRNGRVIGFGARALSEEDDVKYLNSPEGPLFSKGRCFYGFAEAREAVRSGGTAVIVEGYTDVIMAHQFGVEPVMAVLGTALTEYHARTLAALCDRVVLVFDADEAGQKSAARSIETLLGEDLDVRVATLEADEDPCEFLLAHGPDAFRERLERSEDFLAFRLRRARQQHDVATVSGRRKVFEDLAELALKVRNEASRDMLIRQIAGELGIAELTAWAYLERVWRQRGAPGGAPEGPRARVAPEETIAFELLGFVLCNPQLQAQAGTELKIEHLEDSPAKALLDRVLASCRDGDPVDGSDFVHRLSDLEEISLTCAALQEEHRREESSSTMSAGERYGHYRDYLERRALQRQKERLLATVAAAGKTEAPMSEEERLRAYQELRRHEDRKKGQSPLRKERE